MCKFFSLILVALVTAFFASTAFAVVVVELTDPAMPWLCAAVPKTGDAVKEGHVKDWIKENGGKGELDLSNPDNGPEAGDLIGKIDKKYAWKAVKTPANGIIDFQVADIFGAEDNIVAYMYLYVTSDADKKVIIYGGSDDCLKIFVNGKMVHDNPALRGTGADQDVIKDVQLKKGKNGILFKVSEQGGGWGGYGRIAPVAGLKASSTKKADGDAIKVLGSNIYMDEFLNLLVPNSKPDAALDAHKEDLIATASGGKFTEAMVASGKGATRGVMVGKEKWTEGKIPTSGGNNLQIAAEQLFGRKGDQNNLTWYGYTVVSSPNARTVKMRAGSDDSVKVWINGVVVHDNPVLRGASGFLDTFDAKFNPGPNPMLIKVCEQGGGWSGFLGFSDAAAYSGLSLDSSTTLVAPIGKLPNTWGNLKK